MKFIVNHFWLLLLFPIFSVVSQEQVIRVSTERKEDKSVVFKYQKDAHGSYYLQLLFDNIANSRINRWEGTVFGRAGTLLTLTPESPNQNISFTYRINYMRGELEPKYIADFVYMIPYREGESVFVEEVFHIGEKYFGEEPESWSSYSFSINKWDTVYAPRKGLVVEISEDFSQDTTQIFSFRRGENFILVEHEDGTLSRMMGFEEGGIFVEPGQSIIPREPIGMVSSYDQRGISQIRMFVYYLKTISKNTHPNEPKKLGLSYIDPLFLTNDGADKLVGNSRYQVVVDSELVVEEFSRREKRRYEKGKL